MSSCLADYAEASVNPLSEVMPNSLTTNENCGRVRRSAAMIGLAISMSATGLLLAQNKAAVAANSSMAKAALSSLPAPSNPKVSSSDQADSQPNQLVPLALKHTVKSGESIRQLAQDYKVEARAIAALNKLSVEADLVPGKPLRIPSPEVSRIKVKSVESELKASQSPELASKYVNTSLDHLRETRKRLQDSLAELKTEKSNYKSDRSSLLANVSDVSQPLKAIDNRSQGQESLRETTMRVMTLEEGKSVVASSSTKLLESTHSVSPSLAKVEIPAIKSASLPSIRSKTSAEGFSTAISNSEQTSQSNPTTLPSLTKLPSVPQAKIEESELPQFNEPIAIPVSPSENPQTSTTAAIPSYSSTPGLSVGESPKVQIPQEPIPTQQARIVPKPQVTLTQTKKAYRVKPGDTLNSIARSHGLTLSQLIRANGINNPNVIKVNQSLVIPQPPATAQSPAQTRNIPNLPHAGNLVASSPSRFPDSLLPVPLSALSSSSSVEVNTSTQENNSSKNDASQPIEISITPSQDSYTEQLKADIANLEQEYAARPKPGAIEIQPDTQGQSSDPIVGQTLNPEWASDRKNTSPAQQTVAQRLSDDRSRLVGAAPSNTEQYNDAFRIPVGTNVGPELPPLSVPDNYLPDAPMQFNGYIWPSKGVLTSGYGRRWGRMHKGIDIAAPIGTPIMAAAPGEVITAGWNSGGYGKLVKVRHPDGSITLYAHNSRLLVRRGQTVEQGQQIAEMGSTGYSTGPHLHFEVHPSGRGAVNPIALLPKNRK